MAQLTVVYWRDIPAQVIVKKGRRDEAKIQLSERFEKAIDRAAMKAKLRDTDSYLGEWRKASIGEVGDDLGEAGAAFEAGEAGALEVDVVVVVEVVEADDFVAAVEQALGDVRADEAGGAGDEDFHGESGVEREAGDSSLPGGPWFLLQGSFPPHAGVDRGRANAAGPMRRIR